MTNQFPIHVTILLCHAQKVHSKNDCVYIYLYYDCTIHTTPSICDKSYNKYKMTLWIIHILLVTKYYAKHHNIKKNQH